MSHIFFKGSPNFALSVFAFAVEGWLFYSAVNSVIPQMILNLGFESDSLIIAVRGLASTATAAVASMIITYVYAVFGRYEDFLIFYLLTV